MAAANNADVYANSRLGIFFTGQPAYLTGQCVSLVKWYIGDMCGVKDFQSARGHAKDFGDTLVRQGLATKVSSPKRGDLAVWKQDGGSYGHIGVVLSRKRVFEQNVAVAGTASKNVGGNIVYASRIDPLDASWRKGSPTYYRLKGYKETSTSKPAPEGGKKVNESDLDALYKYGPLALGGYKSRGRKKKEGSDVYLGKTAAFVISDFFNSKEAKDKRAAEAKKLSEAVAARGAAEKNLATEKTKSAGLAANLTDLTKRLDAEHKAHETVEAELAAANAKIKELMAADKPVTSTPDDSDSAEPVPSTPHNDTNTALTRLIEAITQWFVSHTRKN
ncbi:CHAP domain-containing protein [Glutamicibacter halophytocola]|uniref:CHAP domain-containing protein n=1 Tax=Glutamicibacter halophytocola TaxID=1933880 RepID=UPI0015C54BB3|nr:CHAP domain-containing protein [Glutamicibacter halophytocola]NQD39954.1 CHAP domain-containing protein [Glutamicibacter halophytocola]